MLQSLEQFKKQFESQLDIALRLVQANGSYAEKMVTTHCEMLRELLRTASVPGNHSNEASWTALNKHGKVLAEYGKAYLRDGLDYQNKVLAELSRK